MRNQGQLFFGGFLIVFGLMFLAGQIFQIDTWALCWPLALILLGVWLIFRPQLVDPGTGVNFRPLGGVRRYGAWQVSDEEIWMFVGDIHFDLVHASLPPGESTIRLFGFIGDINLVVPRDVVFSINAASFITDADILNDKRDHFLNPVSYATPGYETAERKLRLETNFFILDLDVNQV